MRKRPAVVPLAVFVYLLTHLAISCHVAVSQNPSLGTPFEGSYHTTEQNTDVNYVNTVGSRAKPRVKS